MRDVMLTTTDNPFDPFTEFTRWKAFDEQMGYNTLSYLARIAKTSIYLSEADNLEEIERSIDNICRLNLTGKYKKVTKE